MMPEDVVKRLPVTFATGLPMGVRGTFKHNGQLWIAYPQKKNRAIITTLDRMLGIHNRIIDDMVKWINTWPDDTERVLAVIDMSVRARKLYDELTSEKAKAVTE